MVAEASEGDKAGELLSARVCHVQADLHTWGSEGFRIFSTKVEPADDGVFMEGHAVESRVML